MAEEKFQDGTCKDRIVEWGHSKHWEPTKLGMCGCYRETCEMPDGEYRDGFKDLGEHMIRFYPLRTYTKTSSVIGQAFCLLGHVDWLSCRRNFLYNLI